MSPMKLFRRHLQTTPSTNRWVREHLSELPRDCWVAVDAEEQSAGYGRYGRRWLSPKGGLPLTLARYWPDRPTRLLTAAGAVGVAEALQNLGLSPSLKWPNDVLIGKKKVAGVLVERLEGWLIVGVGLNLALSAEFLASVDQPATSLSEELHGKVGREMVRELVTRKLIAQIEGESVLETYRKLLIHKLGERVRTEEVVGSFGGVDDEGQLILILDDGERDVTASGVVI